MNEDQTIKQFLGDRPGSDQLREWRETLELRVQSLQAEQKRMDPAAAVALDPRIAQLKRQVAALREEEAVTRYVEDSVRVTLAMGAGAEGDDFEE